jgi:FemAB-related protein (PEP-CTERM system-associated)
VAPTTNKQQTTHNLINIRTAQESDAQKWDAYILNHPNATPYHLWAWKQAIETAYGHRATYLLAEKDSAISGALPLFHLRLAPFVNQLVSLPFCDVGNCLADDAATQDGLIDQAIRLKPAGRTRLDLRGALLASPMVQSQLQVIDSGKHRLILQLPGTAAALFNSFKSKLRSQVRKAEKNGVQFRWGGVGDMDAAYPVFATNMHELGSPVHAKSFLGAVLFRYADRAKMGLAEFEGETIGMGIILSTATGVCIPWASTRREYNRLAPNMLLYWNFLKYSAENGYDCFDFGRSTIGEGTYKFKQQWGAKPVPLVWYELKDTEGDRKGEEKTAAGVDKRALAAEVWRKLPLRVANTIGPHLRKYISL